MKKAVILIFAFLLISGALISIGCNKRNETLILATTTSLNDTGLLNYLIPEFSKKTGLKVKPIAVGSGEALKMGEKGDADIVLSHSPAKEQDLLKNDPEAKRTPFMYNYFVIVGPKDDPADISAAPSAEKAFKRITDTKQIFISRADESGTNEIELGIWEKAGIKPIEPFYIKTGQGMLETLEVANEKKAYTLTDKATYLSSKNNLKSLSMLLTDKESLKNVYSLIELNDKKLNINTEAAKKFKNWLLSKQALTKISNFGIETYKEPLFFIN